jgi:acyl-CoA thioesterase-2
VSTSPGEHPSGLSLLDLLHLERLEEDAYRSNGVYREERQSLFGGQVAAQALLAAGLTVPDDRSPHSLHGSFLRRGDSERPIDLRVLRDRDGRSFSVRRVEALQDGAVIFTMSGSFHVRVDGPEAQTDTMPCTDDVAGLPSTDLYGLFSLEGRLPRQPYAGSDWPTRFWVRVTVPLPGDDLIHACAVTYLSDVSHGILPAPDGSARARASLDHALWFHRRADANGWLLVDFSPRTSGQGRAWYSGSIFGADGALVASVGQEMLFR